MQTVDEIFKPLKTQLIIDIIDAKMDNEEKGKLIERIDETLHKYFKNLKDREDALIREINHLNDDLNNTDTYSILNVQEI